MDDETNDTDVCALCDRDLDHPNYDDEPWGVDDSYALHHGYNLRLEGDPDNPSYAAHHLCLEDGNTRGSTYVLVMPEYPDDPEAGGIRSVSCRVNNGVMFSHYPGQTHDPIQPDTREFETVVAYELERDLPAEWTHQYEGVSPDAEWEQIGTGWHDSMSGSSASEVVNSVTRGEVGLYGPMIVKFSETNNVCSVGLTLYAPEGLTAWSKEQHERVPVRQLFKGTHSRPGGAFGIS